VIGIGIGPMQAALYDAGGSAVPDGLEQIQVAIAAGEVDGGLPASTYTLTMSGGIPATASWEATCDGGTP
jgi:hypothetical protein